ncbi:MAG: hypothetical protein J0M10_18135 [Chitinophagales bacterium]|nr:hypothetical protein [Chitinophagales bacterium]
MSNRQSLFFCGEWRVESGEWKVGEERYSFVRNKTGLLNKKAASIPERLF